MVDRIEVRLGELSQSAATVQRAAQGIVDCAARIQELSGTAAATGSSACAASFEAMVGLWADQLTFSAEEVDALARATEEARAGYETNERATGGMFGVGKPR